MCDRMVRSGFLIEKTFARMCREFLPQLEHFRPGVPHEKGYSWPLPDVPPGQMAIQYRGLDREPMQSWTERLRGSGVIEPTDEELAASLYMLDMEETGKVADDFVLALEDAKEVLRKIAPPVEREIIWVRPTDALVEAPRGTMLLGYEPNTFYAPEPTSRIADWIFFNYRRDLDPDAMKLRVYYEKLNKWGLFDSAKDAKEYLDAYLSFTPEGWDEHYCTYYIAEVREIAGGDD